VMRGARREARPTTPVRPVFSTCGLSSVASRVRRGVLSWEVSKDAAGMLSRHMLRDADRFVQVLAPIAAIARLTAATPRGYTGTVRGFGITCV